MRTTSGKAGVTMGIALLAASAAFGPATASADPSSPAGHEVTYRVSVDGPGDVELFYLTTQPANMAAYNADAYAYVKKEPVSLAPEAPWEFKTTLADPQWAILTVSSTTHGGRAAPHPRCEILIDGQSAVAQDADYNPRCQLSQW